MCEGWNPALSESTTEGPCRALHELAQASKCLERLDREPSSLKRYHRALASVHAILGAAQAAEELGAPLIEMRSATETARRHLGQLSSILAHTQRWPRGYSGDFELIERLLDAHPRGEPDGMAYLADRIVLNLPLVEQHRAKVAWQAGIVRQRLRGAGQVRVLSIACGGCRDLSLMEPGELGKLSLVLNDLDPAALELSRSRMQNKVDSLMCVQGNVLRRSNQLRALGPFDVILVGGLLDYLPERAARTVMQHGAGMLARSGILAATNIATGNPWRLFLELLADWTLIHRNQQDMRGLFDQVDGSCEVKRDHTGLTWLGSFTRAPGT